MDETKYKNFPKRYGKVSEIFLKTSHSSIDSRNAGCTYPPCIPALRRRMDRLRV